MARMYAELWRRIAANEEVVLTCKKTRALVLTQAIYREKSRNKLVKDATEQPSFGRLSVIQSPVEGQPDKVRLTCTITYSGSNL